MGGVFVNYRNGPHFPTVLVLHLLLEKHLGPGRTFLDVHSIRYGERYPDFLREKVSECDVLLAVIHPTWTTDSDAAGRRIDQPGDWVRSEIRQAFDEGKTIVPVLLADPDRPDSEARMPSAAELPDDLAPLALAQGPTLRRRSFVADVDRVLAEVALKVTGWTPPPDDPPDRKTPRRWAVPLAILCGLLGVAGSVGAVLMEPGARGPVTLLALWLTLLLVAPALAATVVALGRKPIREFEALAHKLPPRRYLYFAAPLLIGPMTFMVAVMWQPDESGAVNSLALPFAVLVYSGIAVALGVFVLRGEEREREWPPTRGPRSYPGAIRRELVRLRERLDTWEHPITADRAAQSAWLLRQIGHRVDDVAALAAQSRRRWALAEYPKSTAFYLACLGLILGACAVNLAVRPTLAAVVVSVVACALTAIAVDLHYRTTRATRWALVREMRGGRLAEVRRVLDDVRRFTLGRSSTAERP